jgi:hypothetical protein
MGTESEVAEHFSFPTSLANAGEPPQTINLSQDPEGLEGSANENR